MDSMKHMVIILSKALLSSNVNQWYTHALRQHMNNILLPECFQEELNEFGNMETNTEQPKRIGWCGHYHPEWGAKLLPKDVNEYRKFIDALDDSQDEHGYFDIGGDDSYLAYRFNNGMEARLCSSYGTWSYYLPNDNSRSNFACTPKLATYLYRRTEDLMQINREDAERKFNDARAAGLLKLTNNITKIRDRLVEADQFSKYQVFSNGSSACKVIWNQAHEDGDQFTLSMDSDDFTINKAGLLVVRQCDGTTKDLLLYSVKVVNKLIDMTEYVNEHLGKMISYPRVGDLKLERPEYGYYPDTTINLSVVCDDNSMISKQVSVWFKDLLTKEERERLNAIRIKYNTTISGRTINDVHGSLLHELDGINEEYIVGAPVSVDLSFGKVSGNYGNITVQLHRPNVPKFLAIVAQLCNVTWHNVAEYPEIYVEVMGRSPVVEGRNHYVTGPHSHTIDPMLIKDAIIHLRDYADLSEFTR